MHLSAKTVITLMKILLYKIISGPLNETKQEQATGA